MCFTTRTHVFSAPLKLSVLKDAWVATRCRSVWEHVGVSKAPGGEVSRAVTSHPKSGPTSTAAAAAPAKPVTFSFAKKKIAWKLKFFSYFAVVATRQHEADLALVIEKFAVRGVVSAHFIFNYSQVLAYVLDSSAKCAKIFIHYRSRPGSPK